MECSPGGLGGGMECSHCSPGGGTHQEVELTRWWNVTAHTEEIHTFWPLTLFNITTLNVTNKSNICVNISM